MKTKYTNIALATSVTLHNVLDPVEQRVIEQLASMWSAGVEVPVLDVMLSIPSMSPSTIHRRLKALRSRDLLTLVPNEKDSRIKFVTPTEKLLMVFGAVEASVNMLDKGGK
jgi:hypothetical protein